MAAWQSAGDGGKEGGASKSRETCLPWSTEWKTGFGRWSVVVLYSSHALSWFTPLSLQILRMCFVWPSAPSPLSFDSSFHFDLHVTIFSEYFLSIYFDLRLEGFQRTPSVPQYKYLFKKLCILINTWMWNLIRSSLLTPSYFKCPFCNFHTLKNN